MPRIAASSPDNGPPKSREVVRLLAEMVEAEGLGVGDRLPPEVELARRFGLGRSTVREALRQWESLGIIARNKGAGTRIVTEITTRSVHLPLTVRLEADSLQRMLEVRRPLEIEAVRLAARASGQAVQGLIMQRMTELMAVYEAGGDWRPADYRFHEATHRATGNPLFGKMIDQLYRGFHDIYDAPFNQPQLGHATIPLHRTLALAIVEGNEPGAVRAITRILDDVLHTAAEITRGPNV